MITIYTNENKYFIFTRYDIDGLKCKVTFATQDSKNPGCQDYSLDTLLRNIASGFWPIDLNGAKKEAEFMAKIEASKRENQKREEHNKKETEAAKAYYFALSALLKSHGWSWENERWEKHGEVEWGCKLEKALAVEFNMVF